jgi:hypothetical protein
MGITDHLDDNFKLSEIDADRFYTLIYETKPPKITKIEIKEESATDSDDERAEQDNAIK